MKDVLIVRDLHLWNEVKFSMKYLNLKIIFLTCNKIVAGSFVCSYFDLHAIMSFNLFLDERVYVCIYESQRYRQC